MPTPSLTVLHVNSERGWRGGEQQMTYLAQGLQARGHRVHLACRPGGECLARLRALALPASPLPIRADLDLLAARRLARLADDLGADIIHAHASRAHLPSALAKAFTARPLRCVVHRRVDFSLHKLPLRLSALKYRWGVDRYIAITRAVQRVMTADGIPQERIAVIHSSVDLARFDGLTRNPGLRAELGLPQNAPLIATVGALVPHKGQIHLIEAAAHVLRHAPDTWFLILGEGPLRPQLQARARQLNVAPRLLMPGFRNDVPRCLLESDLFCMPSVMEGLGTAALEAMALKRPVVATTAGGLAEVLRHGENGLAVPPADPPALADALLRLLKDPPLAERLAAEGRRTVEKEFTADRMVERTIELYRRLLDPPQNLPPSSR